MHRWIVLLVSLGVGLVFQPRSVLCSETGGAVERHCPADTPLILKSAADAVVDRLNALDRDLAASARRLAALDLKQDAARTVIRQLQMRHADIVIDACTISPSGVMLLVEPSRYRPFEGKDISDQEQIQTLLCTRQPVMSKLFRTVEGMEAVDVEYPVVGPDGKYRGSVSVIFQPWVLIGGCVRGLVAGMPVDIRVMQPDGTIIYDANPDKIGRSLFADPDYQSFPEPLKVARKIAAEREGHGSYSCYKTGTNQETLEDAWWITLTFHGMSWRLVEIHPGEAPAGFQ